jgi:hypothetical protein
MTRTVAWLRKELEKFPDDAECFAYEGEVTGIIIGYPHEPLRQGVIHCSEQKDTRDTQLLPIGAADDSAVEPQ